MLIAYIKIFVKKISKKEGNIKIQFYFSLNTTVVLTIPYYINSSTISLKELFFCFFNSHFWTACSIFYNRRSKKFIDAIKVMPFDYSRIVFSSFIGFSFLTKELLKI